MQPGDLSVILPEIVLSVYAMIALLVGVYGGKDRLAPLLLWVTTGLLVAVALWIGFQGRGTTEAFGGMFVARGSSNTATTTSGCSQPWCPSRPITSLCGEAAAC